MSNVITPFSVFSQIIDFFLRHKRLFILFVVVFFAAVGLSALFRGGIGPPPRRTDLTVFLRAAEAIQSGENIYFVSNARGWYYVYLPLLAILLAPFTRLPLIVNTSLWYAMSVTALCGAIFLSTRLVQERPSGRRIALMAGLFCVPSLIESMTRGQMGAMTIFLAVAILYLYVRGRPVWAGMLFAFSVVLKASPLAPLIIFFLVKREWKIVISAIFGIFFFAWLFPSLAIGIDRNWLLLKDWIYILTHAVSSTGSKSPLWSQLATPLAWDNQSLYAVFTRWTFPTETALAARDNSLIRWAVRLAGAAAVFMLAFVSRRRRMQPPQKRVILEYALFLILMILFSPVSEIHHYTIFFLLFFAVFLYVDDLPRNSVFAQCLAWSSVIAGLTQILGYIELFGLWGLPAIGGLIFWCVSFIFLLNLYCRQASQSV